MSEGLAPRPWDWHYFIATAAVIAAYELVALAVQQRRPGRFARSAHADLREQWFAALSTQKGSEILAVQTLRNSLMSATMLASTAALALMGTLTLSTPTLRSAGLTLTPHLAMELLLIALLLASLLATVMSVRFYNHASYVVGCPVGSDERQRWEAAGRGFVRKAGMLYSVGLRQLVLVAPVVSGLLSPPAGLAAGCIVVAALLVTDRVP